MMKSFRWWAFSALAITIAAGCGSNSGSGEKGDASTGNLSDGGSADDGTLSDGTSSSSGSSGGGDGAGSTGSPDGANGGSSGGGFGPDGSVSVNCTAFGGSCSFGASCCSGICDTSTGTCSSSPGRCAPATAACAGNTDCCSGACINGQCGATQCLTIGAACPVAGNACCTGNCSGGTCQPISPGASCVTANNTCSSNAQCCSGLCDNGRCALGSSYCIQTGDICYHANDCCGGLCSAPNNQPVTATNPGVCSQPSSGMVNCTAVDGAVCPGGGCGQCCSRLCAPYGPTGVNICQPARGCRVEGDLCRSNSDCCGAAGSGVLGDGEVSCSNNGTTAAVGVCLSRQPDGGGACVPEGDVCHYHLGNYTCGISSATADCCGSSRPKFDACVLDPFGVPRCNVAKGVGDGGTSCVQTGNACSSATECCTGHPCVVGTGGQLQCSANVCQMAGQTCTTNADCCAGLPCVALPGSINGTCSPVTPPPPPPSDGGTTTGDAGTSPPPSDGGGGFSCALYGQSCTSLPCCTGTQCISGICSTF